MDPISGSNSSNLNRAYGASEVRASNSPTKPTSAEASKVSLTDLGELANRVDQSAKDVRPEVIERAKLLLDDPNWMSDENIDRMLGKIIQNEDF